MTDVHTMTDLTAKPMVMMKTLSVNKVKMMQ